MKRRRITVVVPVELDELVDEHIGERKLTLADVNVVDGIVTLVTTPRA